MLAAEYGWSKTDILVTVYPEELISLAKSIRIRQLKKRLDQYEFAMFPNVEAPTRKQRFNDVLSELRTLEGLPEEKPQLDRSGLKRLKGALSGESRSRIKVKR